MKLIIEFFNSTCPRSESHRAGQRRWPVCPLSYRPRLRCHSYQGTRFQTPVTVWTPGDPNIWYSSPVFHAPLPLASSHHPPFRNTPISSLPSLFQSPVTAWTPGEPNVWYSSPVSHIPSPLASSHHPEWTIGIQGSTICDLTRWKIRHVLICEWSRRTCAITCSGYHRQAENQKTYQNNGFDGQIDSWFTRRGFFIFCAVYPIQGAELSGIQHGSPGIIYNIVLFMGNISATGSWRGRCC